MRSHVMVRLLAFQHNLDEHPCRQTCRSITISPTGKVAFCSAQSITGMTATLSSYALVGLDAVHVEFVADGDRAKGVEPANDRCLHSVKLRTTESGDSIIRQVVNVRTFAPGRSAPA